jgi:hypothetical protein
MGLNILSETVGFVALEGFFRPVNLEFIRLIFQIYKDPIGHVH